MCVQAKHYGWENQCKIFWRAVVVQELKCKIRPCSVNNWLGTQNINHTLAWFSPPNGESFILNQPTLGKTIYDRFKLNRWKGDGSAPTRQQVILIPKFNFVELFFLDLAKLTRSIVTHCVENCNVDKNLKINWLREQKAINLWDCESLL